MITISEQASYRIRVLSFLYALLIVGAHAGYDGGQLSHRIFPGVLIFCGVPFFFFISGLLLFRNFELTLSWWLRAIRKRFVTLYVPFVLWNVIYTILKFGRTGFRGGIEVGQAVLGILGLDVFTEPPCGPFWYIRALLLFVLVAPALGFVLRKFTIGGVVVVLLALCDVFWSSRQLLHTGLKVSSLFWFSSGAYVALNYSRISPLLERLRACSPLVYLACGLLYLWSAVPSMGTCPRTLAIMSVLLGSWIAFSRPLGKHEKLERLFECTFFLYAVHAVAITIVELLLPAAGYHVVWAVAVVISLSAGMLMRRFMFWAYAPLVGGR